MWRLTFANALAHRSRLALTWLAVALGVAFVAGSLVLTDTSSRLLDDQFRTTAAGVDLTVRTTAAFDSAMGVEVQRDPVPPAVVQRVARTRGVADATATASGPAQLQARGNSVNPGGATLLGSWAAPPLTAYRLRSGHAPQGPDDVVLDVATALASGVRLGDEVTVSATGSRRLHVVGLTGVGERDGLANTAAVLVDLPTAQSLLGLGTGASAVDVVAAPDVAAADLRERLAADLGTAYAVTSGQDTAAASADAAKQSVNYLRIVLLALAAAGLLVGGLLIANTFAVVLTQRSRELALLRAAGATGRQVFASVLGEALLVGVTGAGAGTAAGVGAAYALRGLASAAGLALPGGPLTVTARTVGVAVTAGVLVTLLGALGPSRRAARIAPVEAMRLSDPAAARPRRARVVLGAAALGLGLVQLVAAAVSRDIAGVGAGAVLLLAGLVLLGPVLAPRLAGTVGRPVARLGVPGRLARDASVRNPRRTAATATALALGLALVTFVSVLGTSVKSSIGSSYREAVTADFVIESSGNEMLGGLSPEVARRAAALPDVRVASPIRYGHWRDAGRTSALTAVDPTTLGQVTRVRMTSGTLSALHGDGVVLAAHIAAERHLRLGDRLAMTFPRDGDRQLRVVGLMDDAVARALSSGYFLPLSSYARHYSENVDASVLVALRGDADPRKARAALAAAAADFPNAEIRNSAEAVAGRAAALDQVLGLLTVLLLFAVLIALLGITNTLALSIVERTREIGLLRAVGMTRRQLAWMVRAEAVLVAAVAGVAGLAVGLGLAVATLAGLSADTPLVIRVPVGQLLLVVTGAVVAGLVAGLLPARRAGRLDVLESVTAS